MRIEKNSIFTSTSCCSAHLFTSTGMHYAKLFRNIVQKPPSSRFLHSTNFTASQESKFLVNQQIRDRNFSNYLVEHHLLAKPKNFGIQISNLCYVPLAATRSKHGNDVPQPDGETRRVSELICRLVCQNANSGNLENALDCAVAGDCLSPDLVIEVLTKLNNAGTLALLFFRWAEKKTAFHHTEECYNALIESLGKIKQFKMVWKLVDEMKLRGLLSKNTFSLVSRRFARAKRAREALDAFERMGKHYGMKPELQDYNRLLDTLSKSRQVGRAQEVFDKWKNTRFAPDIKSYTILLEGWGQECNLLRLDEVYREMRDDGFEPDVVSYGIMINAYCKSKKYDEAVTIYGEMERKNVKATPHIYCSLINGLGSVKRLNEAEKFFQLFLNGDYPIEAPTYNALVGAYCWSGRMDDAFKLVASMRKCGIGPNTRTYDIMLHHLVRLQKPSEAYSLFRKMNDELGCQPTVSTYEIMVRMFCKEGIMDMALLLWDHMKARGVVPGMHMFSALINGLCNDNKLDEACKYLQQMLDIGMRPPERLCKNLKRFLVKNGKRDVAITMTDQIEKLRKTPLLG